MNDIRPQPGPQERFCATHADICVFGGAAGGGKSFAFILDACRYAKVKGFTGVFFRRTYPQLVAPDGLWDLSMRLFPSIGGRPRENTHDWRFPSGATLVMSHLQHEKDVLSHQGAQYAGIWMDEGCQFTARQFWYILSRNRTTCGVRPFVRLNCNPDPDSFVKGLIQWWLGDDGLPIPERDGAIRWFVRQNEELVWSDSAETLRKRFPEKEPLSFTFIGSRLEDNPALMDADPGYSARLDALHFVERERLRHGNWNVRPAAGLMFRRHWFPVFDEVPGSVAAAVRAWDKAATRPHTGNADPDWTRGVRMVRLSGGPVKYLVTDVASIRDGPGEVDRLIRNTASADGRGTVVSQWQDPGQAGLVDIRHARSNIDGYTLVAERQVSNKVTYAGPLSSACEGGLVGIVRGAWNEAFFSELESFPEGRHDDIVDAASLAYRRLSQGVSRRAAPSGNEAQSKWRPR